MICHPFGKLSLFHKDEVPEIIKWAHYALTLPLHTCSCERVFSINQNLIVVRLRSRLNPKISVRLFKSKNTRQGNNQVWLPKLFKQMKGSKEQTLFISSPDPKGHASYCRHWASVVRPLTFHILINSSEATGPIWTKLWWNGPWMTPF